MPFYEHIMRWANASGAFSQASNIVASTINSENAPRGGAYALQTEYIISDQPVGTYGLGPCVAVVLYDPNRKIAVVVHFDSKTDVPSSLQKIYEELRALGINPEEMRAYVIGGQTDRSEDLISQIYQGLGSIKIAGIDVLGTKVDRSFVFDPAAGIFFYITGPINHQVNQDREKAVLTRRIAAPAPESLRNKNAKSQLNAFLRHQIFHNLNNR